MNAQGIGQSGAGLDLHTFSFIADDDRLAEPLTAASIRFPLPPEPAS